MFVAGISACGWGRWYTNVHLEFQAIYMLFCFKPYPLSCAMVVVPELSRSNKSTSHFMPLCMDFRFKRSPLSHQSPLQNLLYIFQKCKQASTFIIYYSFATILLEEIMEYVQSIIFSCPGGFGKGEK